MINIYDNNSSYVVTSLFGYRNLGSGNEMHNGIDIVSYGSKTVLAIMAGTVIQTVTNAIPKDTVQLRGNYVKIKHNDGTYAYYQHLASVELSVGDKVDVGDKIGIEGNTGRVFSSTGGSGNHLHLEFRDANNNAIDPSKFLGVEFKTGIVYTQALQPDPIEDSDESYIEESKKEEAQINELPNKIETDPEKYGFSAGINGKYEPIYKDFTKPPSLNTYSYESNMQYDLIDQFKNVEKINRGFIYNQNEPYPVDAKINQLEQHKPQVAFNEAEINNALGMFSCDDSAGKINEVISLLDILSKRTEKRLIQLDNLHATTMRYLHRLSSRININCVYYGGQSIYNKYRCIRCLDDNLINDNPVSLDQCLNCTRYEPIIGQVYDIDDSSMNTTIHTSILLDDMQSSRVDNDTVIQNIKIDSYHDDPSSYLHIQDEPKFQDESERVIDWRETTLEEQIPDVAKYISSSGTINDSSLDDIIPNTNDLMSLEQIVNSIFPSSNVNAYNTKSISAKMAYQMLKSEGFAATKYKDGIRDGKQYYSIGYGHQILDSENYDDGITQTQAVQIFKNDIKQREDYVLSLCKRNNVESKITQNQFDSLVCTVYSLGPRSNILTAAFNYIKEPSPENATKYKTEMAQTGIYMQTFEKDENGEETYSMKYNQVLFNRRMYEYEIFMNGAY